MGTTLQAADQLQYSYSSHLQSWPGLGQGHESCEGQNSTFEGDSKTGYPCFQGQQYDVHFPKCLFFVSQLNICLPSTRPTTRRRVPLALISLCHDDEQVSTSLTAILTGFRRCWKPGRRAPQHGSACKRFLALGARPEQSVERDGLPRARKGSTVRLEARIPP